MKTRIILGILLPLILSCSAPLPVEGTWEQAIEEEQTGLTIAGSQTYTFTPAGKKAGSVVFSAKGKATIDSMGEYNFSTTWPGAYTIVKDMLIVANDTTAVQSNIAFHPTSFLGLLSSGYIQEYEQFFRDEVLKPTPVDTFFNVLIKEGKMTAKLHGETVELSSSK